MRRNVYRVLVFIFLVCIPCLFVGEFLLPVLRHHGMPPARDLASTGIIIIALLLEPISAIGLWNDKRWGVLILVVATAVFALGWKGLPTDELIILAVTALRFVEVRKERCKAASDHVPHPPTIG
jgi:chromate transport protein ChrA